MSLMSRAAPRLMPDEVQSASFRPARLGRRGFDEDQVRSFCQQVEAELGRLLDERAALQEEVSRLRRRVIGLTEAGADGPGSRPADAHIQAVGILSRAQDTARHYVAEAQEYSRYLAQEARRRRDEILGQARSQADQVLEEAHREASQAARAALAGPVPPPGADARELGAGELAYLRRFSEVYRTHLGACLDALVGHAEGRDQAEPAGAEMSQLGSAV